jgi:hypothetical protein
VSTTASNFVLCQRIILTRLFELGFNGYFALYLECLATNENVSVLYHLAQLVKGARDSMSPSFDRVSRRSLIKKAVSVISISSIADILGDADSLYTL